MSEWQQDTGPFLILKRRWTRPTLTSPPSRFKPIIRCAPCAVSCRTTTPLFRCSYCCISIFIFGFTSSGRKFFTANNLSIVIPAGGGDRHHRHRPDRRHFDCRHRSVNWRHHGAVFDCHGQARRAFRRAGSHRHIGGWPCRRCHGLSQRHLRHQATIAAFHCDAGYLACIRPTSIWYSKSKSIRGLDTEAMAPI